MFKIITFIIGSCMMWFGVGLLDVNLWTGVTLIALGLLGMTL